MGIDFPSITSLGIEFSSSEHKEKSEEHNYDSPTMASPAMAVSFGTNAPPLASQFYKDFSSWVYNGFKRAPRRPPSWTLVRTPGRTPGLKHQCRTGSFA